MTNSRSTASSADVRLLVGEYVCGLLTPEERPPVHVLLSKDDQALEQALVWENELLALVDALPAVPPPPTLRERLQQTLGIGPAPTIPAFQPPPQPQLLRRPSAPAPQPSPPVPPKSAPAPQLASATPKRTDGTAPNPNEGLGDASVPNPAHTNHSVPPAESDARTTNAGEAAPKAASASTLSAAGLNSDHAPAKFTASSEQNASSASTVATADVRRLERKLWLWRMVSVAACAAALVGFILPGEPPPPPAQVVKVAPTRAAILQAPGTSSTPGWTATLGPEGDLMMRPLVYTEVPAGSQTLLWTRSAHIPQARLLGRIDPNQPVQVPASQLGVLADDQLLEITLEKDEDAASGQPNGPVLFIGQMTVFGSEAAAAPGQQNGPTGSSASGGQVQ